MGAAQGGRGWGEGTPPGSHRLMMWRHTATSFVGSPFATVDAMASLLGARDAADDILQDLKGSVTGHLTVSAVGLFMAIAFAAGLLTLCLFLLCRRQHRTLYAPKSYAISIKSLITMKSSHWGFFKTVLRLRDQDLLRMTGTDAVVFLEFLRLTARILTAVALPLCVILIPIDVTYKQDVQRDGGTLDTLMYLTMGHVQGPRLWAHVILSYGVTIGGLVMIYLSYKKVIRLRQAYFASSEYQTSYFSRALMATDLAPEIRDDASLRTALVAEGIVYPLCEVQMGHGMHDLPELLARHTAAVHKLERYLDRALRSHKRPLIRPTWSAPKVDAITHYAGLVESLEHDIAAARSERTEGAPQSYGFASLAAPAYAHTTAKMLAKKQPQHAKIRLAVSPRDILWQNLMKDPASRRRSRHWARVLLLLLFLFNIVPLLAVSLISNLNAFSRISQTLTEWQTNHAMSFALCTGVLPPLISFANSLLLPMCMRRIAMYRGVRTRQSRDRSLTNQYFTFLFATQFLIFSLIGVVLDLVIMIIAAFRRKDKASTALSDMAREMLNQVSQRFQFQSAYWMTWLCLRGFLFLFELAQIRRLGFLMVDRYLFSHNPRDLYEYTKAPTFSYWKAYAEMLFLVAIGLIYAPLAPLVAAVAAGVLWIALFVYKNQLYYVYATKSETGGRLWSSVVKSLLAMMTVMEVMVALAIGLLENWIKAVICIPPIVVVVLFAWYCRAQLEPLFLWYNPSPMDLARARVHVPRSDRPHLARQFGNVFLHCALEQPIVDVKLLERVRELYDGPVMPSHHVVEPLIPHKTSPMASVDSLPMDEEGLASDLEWQDDEEEGPHDLEWKDEEAFPMKTRGLPPEEDVEDIIQTYAEHV